MEIELETIGNRKGQKFENDKHINDLDKNELFDKLIDDVNGWGTFQIRIGLLSLIVTTLTACNHHSPLYTVYKPKHMCISAKHSGAYATSKSNHSSNEINIVYNFSAIYQEKYSCTPNDYDNKTAECTEWIYDQSVFTDTIVTEWDLVCDDLVLLPTVASSYMAGVVIINTLGGILSDSIGRRKTVLVFSACHLIFSFITAASQSYLMFVGVRFFVGGCIHTVWSAMFVIAIEIVSEPMRNITGAIFNLGWNTGSLVMTLLAFWLRSWWKLQIAFAVLALPLVMFYFLVPESPRWLLEKGKTVEAREVLLNIAKVNKTDIEKTKFYQHFEEMESRILQEKGNMNDKEIKRSLVREFTKILTGVFTSKEYLFRLVLMIPPWLAVGCSAYGIHFSSKLINFDIFSLAAIKEAAAFAIIVLIVPFFKKGKRIPSVLTVYLIGGTLAIAFYAIPANQPSLQVTTFVLCQGFILGLFYVIGTYTQDVFSTDIRGTTFNFLDCISKIGTVFAPFIVDLVGEQDEKLPVAIFGMIVLLASFVLLLLPETKGLPLAQSYKDLSHHSCSTTSVIGKLYHRISNKN